MHNFTFGTGGLHRLATRSQRQRLLLQAFDLGFRSFDLAPAYGNGLNELEVGEAFKKFRHQNYLITKFGIPADMYGARHPHLFPLVRVAKKYFNRGYGQEYARRVTSGAEMRRSLDESLQRLLTDHVERFCLHEPVGLVAPEVMMELADTAESLKKEGKIGSFGVSGENGCVAGMMSASCVDVIQTRLDHAVEGRMSAGKRVAVYGVYQFYMRSTDAGKGRSGFVDFVKGLTRKHPDLEIIVTTISFSTLATFEGLFA